MGRQYYCLSRVAVAVLIGLSPAGHALAQSSTDAQLARDVQNGPWALLEGLDQLLAANPGLAATPDSAAALARAAATPVPDFVGANLPVYQEISDKIIAAAPPAQREAVRRAVSIEIATFVATDIRITPAPEPHTIGNAPVQTPQVGERGFEVGSLIFYPQVQAGAFYDSNIYATRTGTVSDGVGSISPSLVIRSNWDHNALYADAGADLTGYLKYGNENTADWHTRIEGRIDVNPTTRIILGGLALMEHEDRSSPDAVEGLTPTRYWELNSYAGLVHRFGVFNVRVGGALQRITYANVLGLNGEINNHDRNHNRYTAGISVSDNANPAFRPFFEGLADIRRYDHTPDDFALPPTYVGYYRNSDGYRVSVGAKFRLTPALVGEASVGIMGRYYADSRFKPITTPAADADIRWNATNNTTAVVFLDRSIEETTLAGSPGYVYSVVGGRVEQVILPDLTGVVRLAFARADFRQSTRWDNEADMSAGLRYYLSDYTYIGADYRYTQRVSGDSAINFSRHEVFLLVGSAF
ncbi:outer membrane beta-barrel protein [Acidocella sp. KAb 2-4]|uniref:outer membrane beta-barrel protein n=1 Tax=Acidocella sp. KAb 2-4 TaxID=2885158 RepID=UPI001D074D0E|nr:outer membrane beta-barrel protein [Acidocella sp. KAb 2-4]